jgi:hypothetical protein
MNTPSIQTRLARRFSYSKAFAEDLHVVVVFFNLKFFILTNLQPLKIANNSSILLTLLYGDWILFLDNVPGYKFQFTQK